MKAVEQCVLCGARCFGVLSQSIEETGFSRLISSKMMSDGLVLGAEWGKLLPIFWELRGISGQSIPLCSPKNAIRGYAVLLTTPRIC
jgi:hypothetical protein